ncbi:MAG TPA: transporter substrate-binding domain-containing protein [Parachlamydiaceae bacterium]|nr:transporter substrate-binding domain-containing protein [Parachlamydiaceae bacterium]
MKKLFFILIFCAPSLWSSAPLHVGMELSYPPFEMVCNDGRPCGISVDITFALGEFIDRPVQVDNISFVGLIPSLKNRSIDLIISSLTITEERKKAVDFSDPYATTGLCLLLNIKSKVNEIQDVNKLGAVVVVKSGSSGEVYARRYFAQATVRVLDKEAMCVLEVIQGKADAFIYDQISVYTNWQKNQKTTRANLIPFQKENWAIAIRKNNEELLNKINDFIKKFREEGGFDKLADKYLPEQKQAFKQMGVPFVF